MIDTIRISIADFAFYQGVVNWRSNDLSGNIPAFINADVLRNMMIDCKVIDLGLFKEKQIRDVIEELNQHGLNVVIKDFFQLKNMGSWCRDITCVIDEYNHRVLIEFSLPKFVNGQNVDLLFNYRVAILDFVTFIYTYFRVKHVSIEQIMQYELSRVDFCYYYKYQSQLHALDFIRSFRGWCSHKRKRVHFYDTSVMFVGKAYSMKFYMKYDEFQSHDKKELLKSIGSLVDIQFKGDYVYNAKEDLFAYNKLEVGKKADDYKNMISYCDKQSLGMVRCEFTVRKQKLNYDSLFVLKDLLDLDVVKYYEGLLDRMGVLKMGHTQKDECFRLLKHDKKLIKFCALFTTFGKDRINEIYSRNTIFRYMKTLSDMKINMGEFEILKDVDLHVRNEDKRFLELTDEDYQLALKYANGELF
jgi:II/X family phage/plasmid replication protein